MVGEEYAYAGSLILSIVGAIILLGLFIALISFLETRKSKKYRKFVTDMYVAAKTRFLANEDSLDLDVEEKNFKSWSKRARRENPEYDLDNSIEDELMDRVDEPTKKEK